MSDEHAAFADANGRKVCAGDRVQYFDGREGTVIMIFQDGSCYVRFDGEPGDTEVKWRLLAKFPEWYAGKTATARNFIPGMRGELWEKASSSRDALLSAAQAVVDARRDPSGQSLWSAAARLEEVMKEIHPSTDRS